MDASGPPPFVPQPVVHHVPLVVSASKLRTLKDNVQVYYDALTAGDPEVVAARRKEMLEDEGSSSDGDGALIIDPDWLRKREEAYDAASARVWAGMSESDIAREGYKGRLPPAPRVSNKGKGKQKLFPKPSEADLQALRKK
jgi:hypothetical protein